MDIQKPKRPELILSSMDAVRDATRDGVSVETLDKVKEIMCNLAMQRDLFTESDFPLPSAEENNHMYCIYRGADGDLALYVDVFLQGESNSPHDHGDSWAVVAGIVGHETHNLFKRVDAGIGPGAAQLKSAGSVTIGAGQAVSMLEGGIHSVEAVGKEPVMMLHCYGKTYEEQAKRLEFNVEQANCRYGTDATGAITDIPLNSSIESS